MIDRVNRSTQTNHASHRPLEEHSTRSVGAHDTRCSSRESFCLEVQLIDRILDSFKSLLVSSNEPTSLSHRLQSMGEICDELHRVLRSISRIITSNETSLDTNHPFTDVLKNFSKPPLPMMFDMGGRGRRLPSPSISFSPAPSFSSRTSELSEIAQFKVRRSTSSYSFFSSKTVTFAFDYFSRCVRFVTSP